MTNLQKAMLWSGSCFGGTGVFLGLGWLIERAFGGWGIAVYVGISTFSLMTFVHWLNLEEKDRRGERNNDI